MYEDTHALGMIWAMRIENLATPYTADQTFASLGFEINECLEENKC